MGKVCFVCNKPIKGNPVYIAGSTEGGGKFRHERCAPGSKRWFRSEIGKTSSAREYYPEDWAGEEEPTDEESD